eukprot:716052-Hanusia_phi.AAC.1
MIDPVLSVTSLTQTLSAGRGQGGDSVTHRNAGTHDLHCGRYRPGATELPPPLGGLPWRGPALARRVRAGRAANCRAVTRSDSRRSALSDMIPDYISRGCHTPESVQAFTHTA